MRRMLIILRIVAPWLIRAFGAVMYSFTATIATAWVGIPKATERVADYWTDMAYGAGVPTTYLPFIHAGVTAVAFLAIMACWVISSYLTVVLIGIIF